MVGKRLGHKRNLTLTGDYHMAAILSHIVPESFSVDIHTVINSVVSLGSFVLAIMAFRRNRDTPDIDIREYNTEANRHGCHGFRAGGSKTERWVVRSVAARDRTCISGDVRNPKWQRRVVSEQPSHYLLFYVPGKVDGYVDFVVRVERIGLRSSRRKLTIKKRCISSNAIK